MIDDVHRIVLQKNQNDEDRNKLKGYKKREQIRKNQKRMVRKINKIQELKINIQDFMEKWRYKIKTWRK